MTDIDFTADLGETGLAVWREFAENHMDNVDELLQLRSLCKLFDAVDALDESIALTGIMVKGQQGTTVLSGAVTERRITLNAISTLWKQLGYKPATEDPHTRSEKARAAARARWDR